MKILTLTIASLLMGQFQLTAMMATRLVLGLLFLVTTSALSWGQMPVIGTVSPKSTSLPRPETFAHDRPTGAGFASPKQATFEFMHVLLSARNDLLRDDAFNRRFLSVNLRARIAQAIQQYESLPVSSVHYEDHPATPDIANGAFTMAGEIPTSFKLTTGHTDGDAATYEVKYFWGPGRTFVGDQRTTSVILAREDRRWYVDDLYTHPGKSVSARSFYESLVLPMGQTMRYRESPTRSNH